MLKNDDTLLNELLSDENLKIAKQRVKKNKGASGIDVHDPLIAVIHEFQGFLNCHFTTSVRSEPIARFTKFRFIYWC